MSAPPDPRALALQAAALLAVDPIGLGGIVLRGAASPARDAWLAAFRAQLSPGTPWRKMPPQIAEGRLVGGLDLAATLSAGRPIAERGLLAEASGGVIVVPMAERLAGPAVGHLGAALDFGEIVVERDGIAARMMSRVAVILLDEGIEDERAPGALSERLAFLVSLDGLLPPPHKGEGSGRRSGVNAVTASDDVVEALAGAGLAFGVPSLRVATLALRAAKAAAALAGRDTVAAEDAELAAALVFAPRATRLPAADEAEPDVPESEPEPPADDPETQTPDTEAAPGEAQPMADSVVEATRAAIPADLLAALSAAATAPRQAAAGGRSGIARQSAKRGRPAGVRRGAPGHGVRLAIVDTLRAAAPWQPLRRRQVAREQGVAPSRILVRREDFRVGRFKEKTESLTIFVVDASGSAALHRLAEVKGAVELILADCYIRRDSVALIAFRGERAELILPPTRSLTRAKRALAGQAGGGGTPLAAAIDAATLLAQATKRKGQAPLVVLLTDGKANIARTGRPGRAEAEADALAAAQAFRLGVIPGLVLDISPRPGEAAGRLAQAMGARYIPLPYADAGLLSRAVLAAAPAASSNA